MTIDVDKTMSIGTLREVLSRLLETDRVCVNDVRNLTVLREGAYVGYIQVRAYCSSEEALELFDLKPCECGCGKLVKDGLMEIAHPEDERHD